MIANASAQRCDGAKEKSSLRLSFILCVFALCLFLFVSCPVSAQDAAAWQVVVYAEGASTLQVLSAEGVALTIPAGTLPLRVGSFPNVPLVALSDTRRVLAALNFMPYQPLSVTIASFGTCCKTARVADGSVTVANIGSFSPDERRFAVSYLAVTDEAAGQFVSGIVTVDVELGAVIERLESNLGGDYALLRGWNDDGIVYLPLCYGCDQPAAGTLRRWNPDSGEVVTDVGYYDAAQDTLAVTGETIAPARRSDFPLPISETTHINNVLTFGEDARAIYYNPNSLQITGAHWVADGWQVLVEHPNGATLLDRAGVKNAIAVDDQFLVGTPDGWLATRTVNEAVEVVHHTLTKVDGEVIARFYHPIAVVQAPLLGATASLGGFPDVASPVRQIACPNALPSRLIAGERGRAISGSMNLRREPSLTAASIATITTEVFDIIAGPNCDPTGIAWWQVGLGGLHGWMAESKDGVYLLEPVLH